MVGASRVWLMTMKKRLTSRKKRVRKGTEKIASITAPFMEPRRQETRPSAPEASPP